MSCSAACRATAARPKSCSTATNSRPTTNISGSAAARHSPDHTLEAWSADIKGSEYFSIRVRDWADGADHDDLVEETDGGVVWSADAKAFFYVKLDDNHRPMQVWRHRLGTQQADDVLVYEEMDSGWFTHIHESTSGRFCVIAGGDHETSEQRLIDLADPDAPPRLVAAREEGVQYSVADRGDELFILTNADGAIDFKIVTAPLASPERANWRDLIPYREGIYILDFELYAGHLVRLERANALPAIIIRDLASRRRTRHRLRRGGLFARHPWAATNSTPRICASPIRR